MSDPRPGIPARVVARARAHVVVTESGCWISLYARRVPDLEYRVMGWSEGGVRRLEYVHRVAWEGEHGPIPPGLTVDHTCRAPACCNPAHLRLLTRAENSRRQHGIEYPLGATCKGGHPPSSRRAVRNGGGRTVMRCSECRRENRKAAA